MKKLFTLVFALVTVSLHAQTVIGDMETWRPVTVHDPNVTGFELPMKWYSTDSVIFYAGMGIPADTFLQQVYKTNDAHGGTGAIKMISLTQGKYGSLGLLPSMVSNAKIDIDLTAGGSPEDMLQYSGGTAVTNRVVKVSAWIKYEPRLDDTGMMRVWAVVKAKKAPFKDSIVGEGIIPIGGTINTYTKIEAPVIYTSPGAIPERIQVFFASGNTAALADSSTLYVDDVSYELYTGINTIENNKYASIYPNPTAGILYADIKTNAAYRFTLMSMDGKVIDTKTIKGTATLDYSHLPNGSYTYTLQNDSGETQSGKLRVQK